MDQLIEIWQGMHTDQRNMDKKYTSGDLIPQVVKLEKNQKKVLLFKTYGATSILIMLLIIFLSQFPLELNGILGMGIITASIMATVIILNRLRFIISDEERSLSTRLLIAVIETKIKTERKLFTIYLPLMLLFVILGINLMYFEYLTELETRTRILYHSILTISMVVAFLFGLSIRIKRFKKRFMPLLNRIQKFKSAVNT
jgi:hypothetical protein